MERSRDRRWRGSRALLIGLIVVGLALVALVAWIRLLRPVRAGSVVAWLGDADPVAFDAADYGGGEPIDGFEVPFADGAGVGIGFTVRNTSVLPMTIVAVESLEAPFPTPAYLRPERVQDEERLSRRLRMRAVVSSPSHQWPGVGWPSSAASSGSAAPRTCGSQTAEQEARR